MADAIFESVLVRLRRQWQAIGNEEQRKWPKIRRQLTNSAARLMENLGLSQG